MGIDYYGVLSLTKNCEDLDIKRAFRRLILQYNPERQEDKSVFGIFEVIAEAYEVLSNPLHRAVYDQYGEEGLKRGVPGPQNVIPGYMYHGEPLRTYREFFGTTSPYADLLDGVGHPMPLYSLPEGKGVKRKDPTLVRPLLLTLHEIFFGGVKKLKIQHLVLSGCDPITTEMKEKVLTVPIKPGQPGGTKYTFAEEGDQGPTVIAADVVFVTEDRPHPRFQREGNNLSMKCHVSLHDALVGTIITVDTIDKRRLRVPITDIICPEFEKEVEGEGLPIMEDPKTRGNLILRFEVEFPEYLPRSSKKLVTKAWQLAKTEGGPGQPDQIYKMVMKDKMNRIVNKKIPQP